MGHEVQYFGMDHEKRLVGNRAESYIRNMDFHTGRLEKLTYPFRILYSSEARRKLRPVLADFDPDVIHLNNFNFQITPSILYEIRDYDRKKGKRTPVIFTAHDSQLVCPNHLMRIPSSGENCDRCLHQGYGECVRHKCIHNSGIKSLLGSMEGWIYRRLGTYRRLDRMICPSRFMKEKLDTNPLFREKTLVLHNFVRLQRVENPEKKDYVLYFGRYSEEKGIRLLLEVCRSLPEVPFVFAGNGPLAGDVGQVENIRDMGFQSGEALGRLIAEAAFSICPSGCYENCPFSVMESIAYGTPVIGARLGGIPELIREGETGELFRSEDAKELSEKIRELWTNGEKRKRYTENCRRKYFDTVEEYCEKLLRVYGLEEV